MHLYKYYNVFGTDITFLCKWTLQLDEFNVWIFLSQLQVFILFKNAATKNKVTFDSFSIFMAGGSSSNSEVCIEIKKSMTFYG